MLRKARVPLYLVVFTMLLLASPLAMTDEAPAEDGSTSTSVSTDDLVGNSDGSGNPNHANFNMHFAGGMAVGLGNGLSDAGIGSLGGQGMLGMDFVLREPIALSILGGYTGYAKGDEEESLRDMHIGLGLRLRLIADKSGALNEEGGNAAGNLWLDAHFGYHNYKYENHGGVNIGLGYEFSVAKNLNLGPYARFQVTPIGDDLNYMSIAFGLQISVAGHMGPDDGDGDGIVDDGDKCPSEAEDKDGFEDEDGCPETDNDKDGIDDGADKCPDLAGIADNEGCPGNDDDADGVANDADKCPAEAEDKDGFEDEDGCPDLDNDADGVNDDADKCPAEAEDKDGFEDEDGCPDLDNDADGMNDDVDKCPGEAETKNEKDDEDGCPDFVRIEESQFKIIDGKVEFAKNKDQILEASYPALEEIAALIKQKGVKVRVESHTHNKGDANAKLDLSKRRAENVKKFLVEKGADEGAISVEGLGGTKPAQDNATPEGRQTNNRIEFHIL